MAGVLGLTTNTTTNTQGMTLLNVDAQGVTVVKDSYDTAGPMIRQTDASGKYSTTFFDDPATGLATKTVDANETAKPLASQASIRFVYESSGNRVAVIDPVNNVTFST